MNNVDGVVEIASPKRRGIMDDHIDVVIAGDVFLVQKKTGFVQTANGEVLSPTPRFGAANGLRRFKIETLKRTADDITAYLNAEAFGEQYNLPVFYQQRVPTDPDKWFERVLIGQPSGYEPRIG